MSTFIHCTVSSGFVINLQNKLSWKKLLAVQINKLCKHTRSIAQSHDFCSTVLLSWLARLKKFTKKWSITMMQKYCSKPIFLSVVNNKSLYFSVIIQLWRVRLPPRTTTRWLTDLKISKSACASVILRACTAFIHSSVCTKKIANKKLSSCSAPRQHGLGICPDIRRL